MSDSPPPAGESPAIADGVERRLHENALTAARIASVIAAAVLIVAAIVGTVVVLLTAPASVPKGWLAVGAVVFCAGIGAWSWVWPALRHRHISYRVDAVGIRIRRGVLWRAEISVPVSRVQHTDVIRGPIDRGLGLATLIVYTAGTEHASVSLGGLQQESAVRIRDFLIEGGADDAV